MRAHHAFIDDADVDGGDVAPVVPCGPRLAGLAPVLIGGRGGVAVHAPQRSVRVVGIVGGGLVVIDPVRLGELDGRVEREFACGGRDRKARRNAHHFEIAFAVGAAIRSQHEVSPGAADALARVRAMVRRRAATELDQQFVLDKGRVRPGRALRGAARRQQPRRSPPSQRTGGEISRSSALQRGSFEATRSADAGQRPGFTAIPRIALAVVPTAITNGPSC